MPFNTIIEAHLFACSPEGREEIAEEAAGSFLGTSLGRTQNVFCTMRAAILAELSTRDFQDLEEAASRMPGTRYGIADALEVASTGEPGAPSTLKCLAALANVGITVVASRKRSGEAGKDLQVEVDPRALRAAYPTSARLEPHTYVFTVSFEEAIAGEVEDDFEDERSDLMPTPFGDSRYGGGLCDRDELRMQVEVLRQPLVDLGISMDEGLDELCTGLQSPCESTRARCNRIVQAFESCGLRFHATQRSWRLPRAGVLLIHDPEALVRCHPSLSFFEPHRFGGLAVVDRPKRAGNEVRQGLLF